MRVCVCVRVCVCSCVCVHVRAESHQPAREEEELVHSKTGAGVALQSDPTPAESRVLVLQCAAEKTLKIVNLMLSRKVL